MTTFAENFASKDYSAGGKSRFKLDELPNVKDGRPAYLKGIELEFALTATTAESVTLTGREMFGAIAALTLKDRFGIKVIDGLSGHELRNVLKAITGQEYADPTTIAAETSGGTAKFRMYIPFEGAGAGVPWGICGFMAKRDLHQIVERFREGGQLIVDWTTALKTGVSAISITCQPSFKLVTRSDILAPADIRFRTSSGKSGDNPDFNHDGFRTSALVMVENDGAVVNVGNVSLPKLDLLNVVSARELVSFWNSSVPMDVGMHEAEEEGAPYFVPLVWQDRGNGVLDTVAWPNGTINTKIDEKGSATYSLIHVELHNSYALATRLAGASGLTYGKTVGGPVYAKKNYRNAGAGKKAALLNFLLSHKMS